jgi:hypothetical protein
MSKDQKRYFDMYPTALGFDVTHGTNSEKRPLGRGVVITPDRKTVTVFNAFVDIFRMIRDWKLMVHHQNENFILITLLLLYFNLEVSNEYNVSEKY